MTESQPPLVPIRCIQYMGQICCMSQICCVITFLHLNIDGGPHHHWYQFATFAVWVKFTAWHQPAQKHAKQSTFIS